MASASEILEQFQKADDHNNGIFLRSEFVDLFMDLDPTQYDASTLGPIFELLDTNGDGRIHYTKFVEWVMCSAPQDAAGSNVNCCRPPHFHEEEHVDKVGSGLLPASLEVLRKRSGATRLQSKGFTVEQLLKFYGHYHEHGRIERGTTTNEVVRRILIPETANPPRCYMQSNFMKSLGGGRVAKRLVSHAWLSEFANTVLNIVLDASELPRADIAKSYGNGIVDSDELLEKLPTAALNKTYWLCIFAVDEHHAICGDCWKCNRDTRWMTDPELHLRSDPCLICGQAKFNPCMCGSVKYVQGHPDYEIDLFDYVVNEVDALVVSLDADLNSVKRVWVVAEIGKAMQISTVFFRLASGLSQRSIGKLKRRQDLMPSVQDCDATSPIDKERILSDIHNMEGGLLAYDQFINCMLELSFGVLDRVRELPGAAAYAVANVQHLEMDFTWRGFDFTFDCLPDCSFFKKLRMLTMNCRGCTWLTSIDEFGLSLGQCHALHSATLDFSGCPNLTSINELGRGLGQCLALASVAINFNQNDDSLSVTSFFKNATNAFAFRKNKSSGYTISSIDELGKGLGKCQALASATFDFSGQGIISIDEFGKGLGQCQALASVTFKFHKCQRITSIDEFGKGIGQCQALISAAFTFDNCEGITSIHEFGNALSHCETLASVAFNFGSCDGITSIDEFGKGLGSCRVLASAVFKFDNCQGITSIDEFGKGLNQCETLASAVFDFSGCKHITSIGDYWKGLGHCWGLTSASVRFSGCGGITSIDAFGESLGQCRALASAVLNFYQCRGITSIDTVGKGLAHCQTLVSVTFEFGDCEGITSIDEFGKGLGQCQALASACFDFNGCKNITSISELGKGLGKCPALVSAAFNFETCQHIASIDEFGAGLGQCRVLASAVFNFNWCEGITSIDDFGKGLGQCPAFASATFNFNSCQGITSIDEFGRGLGWCQALASATFDFSGCKGITSIHEFGKGLSHCQALASASFDFTGCDPIIFTKDFGKILAQCKTFQRLNVRPSALLEHRDNR